MELEVYNHTFYIRQRLGSFIAGNIFLLYLFTLLPEIKTVCDIGCGTGSWLLPAKLRGKKVFGRDGFTPDDLLLVDKHKFERTELIDFAQGAIATPNPKYDLCMSLEVAEHLPPDLAQGFVRQLTNQSDIVLFSAATKKQGGDNHLNEQWQSYWISLFHEQGYQYFDIFRPTFWKSHSIPFWYLQNTFLFCRKGIQHIERVAQRHVAMPMDVIHPRVRSTQLAWPEELEIEKACKQFLADPTSKNTKHLLTVTQHSCARLYNI